MQEAKMVKSELIQKLSAETDIPPKIAEIAVNTVFNGMNCVDAK